MHILLDMIFSYTSGRFSIYDHRKVIAVLIGLIVYGLVEVRTGDVSLGARSSYYLLLILGFPIYYLLQKLYWGYRSRQLLQMFRIYAETDDPLLYDRLQKAVVSVSGRNPNLMDNIEHSLIGKYTKHD